MDGCRDLYLKITACVNQQKNEDTLFESCMCVCVSISVFDGDFLQMMAAVIDPCHVFNSSCGDFMQEDDYIPHVRDFIALQKAFDKPFSAGNAIARQQNKKPSGKAKAKAAA